MEIPSKFTGARFKDYSTEITWRRSMNYAAAVHDHNPRYFDDERTQGITAPPMMAVALTWPISQRLWEYIEADDFPRQILATQVHYTEHLEFHRPLRPGDKLKIQGNIAAMTPHKAGTLVVIRYVATGGSGDPVFTEHLGGLMRGVKLADEGRGAEDLPRIPRLESESGPVWESIVPIDPLAAHVYDGCSDIFFPIHTSPAFAHRVGLPGIILQGTATLAYSVREIINREAGGNSDLLRSVACRFTGMVFPGSDIRVVLDARVTDQTGTNLFFSVINAEGQKAVSDGCARLSA